MNNDWLWISGTQVQVLGQVRAANVLVYCAHRGTFTIQLLLKRKGFVLDTAILANDIVIRLCSWYHYHLWNDSYDIVCTLGKLFLRADLDHMPNKEPKNWVLRLHIIKLKWTTVLRFIWKQSVMCENEGSTLTARCDSFTQSILFHIQEGFGSN